MWQRTTLSVRGGTDQSAVLASRMYFSRLLPHQPQIPCRGRGQVPQPEAVTDLVFEMYQVGRAHRQHAVV